MFARHLDDTYSAHVRDRLDAIVWSRLVSNAIYRFAPPFIATIARGFDVKVSEVGLALMIGEFAGLFARYVGKAVDHFDRRTTITAGMAASVASTILLAASVNTVMFAASVFLFGLAKVLFDTSVIAWVNEHVPYETRGRIVGIIETSWALGLLLGVALMGLVTTITNWRIGYSVGAAAMALTAVFVVRQLPREDAAATIHVAEPAKVHIRGRALYVVGAMFCLMSASQCLGVTFGPWLEDEYNGKKWITGVVVALGFIELVSSIVSSRRSDAWGKERSVMFGALLMVPAGLLLVVGANHWLSGVALLVIYMAGFEFAVVCLLPVAANLVPGATGASLGAAVGAGTSGRAIFSFVATRAYEHEGLWLPAVLGAVLAAAAAALIVRYAQTAQR